jgi:septum formation protein
MRYLDVPFEVEPSDIDEEAVTTPNSVELARLLAVLKAQDVATRRPGCAVIGADTVVAIEDIMLGKPVDADDAVRMLRLLAGRWHTVTTGVAIAQAGRTIDTTVTARVHMRSASDAEVLSYVASGEPMDKAGAYAVQGLGRALVDAVDGCYLTVVGFPLCAVSCLLEEVGIDLPVDSSTICEPAAEDLRRRAVVACESA